MRKCRFRCVRHCKIRKRCAAVEAFYVKNTTGKLITPSTSVFVFGISSHLKYRNTILIWAYVRLCCCLPPFCIPSTLECGELFPSTTSQQTLIESKICTWTRVNRHCRKRHSTTRSNSLRITSSTS